MISLVATSASAATIGVGGGVLADASGGNVLSVAIVTAVSAVVVALIGAVVTIYVNRRATSTNDLLSRALDSALDRAEHAEAALDEEREKP